MGMPTKAQIAGVLDALISADPMWVDDNGVPLDYLPEREARIADFVDTAADAILLLMPNQYLRFCTLTPNCRMADGHKGGCKL